MKYISPLFCFGLLTANLTNICQVNAMELGQYEIYSVPVTQHNSMDHVDFCQSKLLYFDSNSIGIFPKGPIYNKSTLVEVMACMYYLTKMNLDISLGCLK